LTLCWQLTTISQALSADCCVCGYDTLDALQLVVAGTSSMCV